MARDYQYNYAALMPSLFNSDRRIKKADTIVRVCQDFIQSSDLAHLDLLDVGSSNGNIDKYLADYFHHVTGLDIDEPAMAHARETFGKSNLRFEPGDAMHMPYPDHSFDVVVCTQIYEHVPDATRMFAEIFRVLKPGGFCYFSGNNRIMFMEPHYKLPLLSVLPRPLAHRYVRLAGKGSHYHELHFSYWTLKRLCKAFNIVDYSAAVVAEPEQFGVDYMIKKGTLKWQAAHLMARYAKWASPLMWILQKPIQDRAPAN
jgi:2-polyprenyl-3-methyl-5-hydroxy-6-metoxy-1,4-benzoquinol methylase